MIYNLSDEYQRADFKKRANELYKKGHKIYFSSEIPSLIIPYIIRFFVI